jgi:hypothetical protein
MSGQSEIQRVSFFLLFGPPGRLAAVHESIRIPGRSRERYQMRFYPYDRGRCLLLTLTRNGNTLFLILQ